MLFVHRVTRRLIRQVIHEDLLREPYEAFKIFVRLSSPHAPMPPRPFHELQCPNGPVRFENA
jgi:hypothetical protein